MEYSVRVTIAVERNDHIGSAEDLSLDWACIYVDAKSLSDAAQRAANETPDKVGAQLRPGVEA